MRGSELATGIAARYDKLAERCWILTLVGGGVPRLYTNVNVGHSEVVEFT
jgi:hypothetical protein